MYVFLVQEELDDSPDNLNTEVLGIYLDFDHALEDHNLGLNDIEEVERDWWETLHVGGNTIITRWEVKQP